VLGAAADTAGAGAEDAGATDFFSSLVIGFLTVQSKAERKVKRSVHQTHNTQRG
jgi:hypothetical protein